MYKSSVGLMVCLMFLSFRVAIGQTKRTLQIFTTADSTNLKLSANGTAMFEVMTQPLETQTCIFIDPNKTFQTFLGIGGALTDASAETFAKLPKVKQDELIQAYFDKEKGIGYNLARTNIHSCDFSSDMYTYVKEEDTSLATFSVNHDKVFRIPFIKQAIAATGSKLTLFVSPWSPPAFMKSNNNMLRGGSLKKEFYQSWANYFVKFIKAYEVEGIPVWGTTIQNEPMAKQRWESCIFTADEEIDFLKNYLGPTLKKAGLSRIKIIGWDHNRDLIYQRGSALLNDPDAAKYLWGIGYHWYENWSGGAPTFNNLKLLKEAFPNTNLLFTEGCKEHFDLAKIYNWQLGEKYADNMIQDFNNGTVGFADWNILLDETGGPNHVQNFSFSPIHANVKTGELMYTNAYYYIGHFSKFIKPGAKRIVSSASRSQLQTTAFKNLDGSIAVIVMNQTSVKSDYYVWINGKAAKVTALPHSIATLLL